MFVFQHPSPANIFNVPNLIEDREYDFRVFAVNEAGESRPTETARKVKVKDPKGQFLGQVQLLCCILEKLTCCRLV